MELIGFLVIISNFLSTVIAVVAGVALFALPFLAGHFFYQAGRALYRANKKGE